MTVITFYIMINVAGPTKNFAIKLGHFIVNVFFSYFKKHSSLTAKKRKIKKTKFDRIDFLVTMPNHLSFNVHFFVNSKTWGRLRNDPDHLTFGNNNNKM